MNDKAFKIIQERVKNSPMYHKAQEWLDTLEPEERQRKLHEVYGVILRGFKAQDWIDINNASEK